MDVFHDIHTGSQWRHASGPADRPVWTVYSRCYVMGQPHSVVLRRGASWRRVKVDEFVKKYRRV